MVLVSGRAGAETGIVQLFQTHLEHEFFKVALGDCYAFWSHYSQDIYMWKTSDPVKAGEKISHDDEVMILSASGKRLVWTDGSDDVQLWDDRKLENLIDECCKRIGSLDFNGMAMLWCGRRF